MVAISYNSNWMNYEHASGETVAAVRKGVRALLGIPSNAISVVNRSRVEFQHRIYDDDHLEFVVLWGCKGDGFNDDEPMQQLLACLRQIETSLRRIADHVDPPPPNVVTTDYIAEKLNCTLVWVARMAAEGRIPRNSIVPGTGEGKPWKFYRSRIDKWIEER